MKTFFLAALLALLIAPLADAQKTSVPAAPVEWKLVPGQKMRVTLTRFTIPDGVRFTPPSLLKTDILPRDLLQYFKNAAKAQNVTPEIYVFPPLLTPNGKTTTFSVGEGVGSAIARDKNGKILDDHQATFQIHYLLVAPRMTHLGVIVAAIHELEDHYTEDDRTHVRSHETYVTAARTLAVFRPGDVTLLPPAFNDRLGRGMLFLSVEPADASPVKPAPPLKKRQ